MSEGLRSSKKCNKGVKILVNMIDTLIIKWIHNAFYWVEIFACRGLENEFFIIV